MNAIDRGGFDHCLTTSSAFRLFNHIIYILLVAYLIVDSFSGFVRLEFGINLKLSLIYKSLLILMMSLSLCVADKKTMVFILLCLIIFLIGPLNQLLQSNQVSFFFYDISFAVKLIMPLFLFFYLSSMRSNYGLFPNQQLVKVLWLVIGVIFINLLLGVMGFGYKTYKVGEGGIGITGYFFAGNELGGLLMVAFCFLLHRVWNNSRILYFAVALFCVFVSTLVATKSSALAAFLSTALVPIVNERSRLLKLTKLKLIGLLLFSVAIVSVSLLILRFDDNNALFSQVTWAYNKFGFWGLIFSGRIEFVNELFTIFSNKVSLITFFFGVGVSGVNVETLKYSAEIDPVDTFVWFGATGLTVMLIFCGYIIFRAWEKLADQRYFYAPCVLLANVILLASACFSGHIWTSGMLGISWAVLNALILNPDMVRSSNYTARENPFT